MASIKNILPKGFLWFGQPNVPNILRSEEAKSHLSKTTLPVRLARIKQDTLSWRTACEEAERPFNPFRVRMQQIYIDTILDGHVKACVERRKDLTMLRDWQIVNAKGEVNDDVAKLIDKPWFNRFISHSLDTLFYGYSLIELGDCMNNEFKDLKVTKRWYVSPDRYVVSNMAYNLSGTPFKDEPWSDWHVYLSTPNDIGTSDSGYGLFYEVAIYQIFLRNILGYNGDFLELFGQPIRVGKTNKTELVERENFAAALENMGSAGWVLMDAIDDQIELIESGNVGSSWQAYSNFEKRLQGLISKLILGHADALDSTPGKLGSAQGGESPSEQAMEDKQSKDGVFIMDVINSELFPRLRKFGFNIPDDCLFEFKNDSEVHEHNDRVISQAVEIKKAGLQMSKDYFEEQTGIKLFDLPLGTSSPDVIQSAPTTDIKAKLKNLYK